MSAAGEYAHVIVIIAVRHEFRREKMLLIFHCLQNDCPGTVREYGRGFLVLPVDVLTHHIAADDENLFVIAIGDYVFESGIERGDESGGRSS